MSDFPYRGDVAATREWLDSKGFCELFVGMEADALLHLEKEDIFQFVDGIPGLRLVGLLRNARKEMKPTEVGNPSR